MIQRIIKIGKNLVVALPENIVERLQLTEGDEVNLTMNPGQNRILIQHVGLSVELGEINQEFTEQVSSFIRDYKPALEKLNKLEG